MGIYALNQEPKPHIIFIVISTNIDIEPRPTTTLRSIIIHAIE